MREQEVSISFATDAPGAQVSSDKSQLTVQLTPPLAIDPMARPTVELTTMRFINQFYNVSAALGNNTVHAKWVLTANQPYYGTSSSNNNGTDVILTIPDGNYSLLQLQGVINARLLSATGWPAGVPGVTVSHIPSINRVQIATHVGHGGSPSDYFTIGYHIDDQSFLDLLGFGSKSRLIDTDADVGVVVQGDNAPQIDLVNAIRVELDVASGNYAPPEATSDGLSRGHSDAIAFIPIQSAPGHQQVYMPADAPQAGVHVGMTERLTIRLRDQAGRNLPSDEHWSGMLTFRGLTPHAR
eukprot:COSAG02_NODE_4818_length_4941_cov_1.653862_1_plen_297_part_00